MVIVVLLGVVVRGWGDSCGGDVALFGGVGGVVGFMGRKKVVVVSVRGG